jgi:carbonic anhydrase
MSPAQPREHAPGGRPFAAMLTCFESSMLSEMIFDCALGELFLISVAGNVVAPSLVGSIELATATFSTRLAVVMGHTGCGVVKATLDVLRGRARGPSERIHDIVDRIRPPALSVLETAGGGSEHALLEAAVRANVRASTDRLRHGSRVLEQMVLGGHLAAVGAQYDDATGVVDFFDVPNRLD